MKHASGATLISNKIDFKPKLIKRNKGKTLKTHQKKFHKDAISVLNIYAPNTSL